MTTFNIDFLTSSEYTYNTDDIEIVGGIAKLKLKDAPPASFVVDMDNTTRDASTYESDKVEWTGSRVQKKLNDNINQTFNQDFASDTGFNYDSDKTEFDSEIANALSGANFNLGIDLSWGGGVLTGTAIGVASALWGKLDLAHNDQRYVDYNADLNADSQQVGAVKFKLTPNYLSTPSTNQYFYVVAESDGVGNNLIRIAHSSSGQLFVQITDNLGNDIIPTTFLGLWSQVIGTEYEFELNWDISTGATRLFINGTQFGATLTQTGTRSSSIGLMRIGNNFTAGAFNSNFYIRDLVIFDSVQHTIDYSSGYSVNNVNSDLIQQKDKAPTNSISWATYTSILNFNYGEGVLTGTPFGSASISGNKLDLAHDDVRYVDYNANLNADNQQRGAIKFKYTPNYSGSPVSTQMIIVNCEGIGDFTNLIRIYHLNSGQLRVEVWDESDVKQVDISSAWSPVLGTTYEIEFNFDGDNGASRLFVDGTQFGTTDTTTFVRNSNIELLRIGNNYTGSNTSNFSLEDLIIFNEVQHTANYTTGYTLEETRYLEDLITFPDFTYSGAGDIQDYTAFSVNEISNARFNVNGYYWNGSSWAISDDSYAQMNDYATINANISSLTENDTVSLKMRMEAGNIQSTVYDLILTYTGQHYLASNVELPELEYTGAGFLQTFDSFSANDNNDPHYSLQIGRSGNYLYWNGSAWVVSNGTYSQSNDAITFNANLGSLDIEGETYGQFKIHFDNSDNQMYVEQLTAELSGQQYSSDSPTIYKTLGDEKDVLSWIGFVETLGGGNEGDIYYQLSTDGSIWKYWNGTSWTNVVNPTDYNTASQINTNLKDFTDNALITLYVKAFLVSDSIKAVELDNLAISYVHKFDCPIYAVVQDVCFKAKKENSCAINVLMKDENEETITDLALADSIKFMLKKLPTDDDSDAIVSKDLANGIIVDNPSEGYLRIILEATDLNIDVGDYYIGLEIKWDDNVKEVCFKVNDFYTNIYSIIQDIVRG